MRKIDKSLCFKCSSSGASGMRRALMGQKALVTMGRKSLHLVGSFQYTGSFCTSKVSQDIGLQSPSAPTAFSSQIHDLLQITSYELKRGRGITETSLYSMDTWNSLNSI
jgi:hypothetical protein